MTVEQVIHDLTTQRFYGSLEIKFESGRVVLLRKSETIKLSDCRDNRGDKVHET